MRVLLLFFIVQSLKISAGLSFRIDQSPLLASHEFTNPITDDKSQKNIFEFSLKSAKSLFYWPCMIGTPPREFNLLVDTGSSDLWLLLSQCNSESCQDRNKYNPDNSITYRDLLEHNLDFEISYISTNVSGKFFFENVILGYYVLKGQLIGGVVKQEGKDLLKNVPMDGIIGLGYPSLASSSPLNFKPFLQNLFQQNTLPSSIFTLNFGKADGSGSLTIGGINKNYLGSEPKYYPVKETGYWQLELDHIMIGDTVVNICDKMKKLNGYCGAIIDSGTTFLGVPDILSNMIYSLIGPGKECNLDKYPSITFVFQGDKYVFEPKDYVLMSHSASGQDASEQKCSLGILPVDLQPPKGPLFILGTLFLKKYYAIFDVDNHRVGLSLIKQANKNNFNFDDYITTTEQGLEGVQLQKSNIQQEDFEKNGWKLIS